MAIVTQTPDITVTPPTEYDDTSPILPGDIESYQIEIQRMGNPSFVVLDPARAAGDNPITFNLVTDYAEPVSSPNIRVRVRTINGLLSAPSNQVARVIEDVQTATPLPPVIA